MQEQISDQIITLSVKAGTMTAQELAKALEKALAAMEKQVHTASQKRNTVKVYKGKQTVKQLIGQGAGVSNIEINDKNIGSFEPVARKYGIDYALKKDSSENPPKWLVFFKSRDADAMTAAFREFTAKTLKKQTAKKPSILQALAKFKEMAKNMVSDRVKHKAQEQER